MPAALSKMISQNLQTLSKMISIQWLLIFKKVSLYLSALASLKPQAAPGILPGAAMPAALSKMISENLRTLSKMISIQWLLIFKKVSLYLSALASLKPQAAPGILPGAVMPAALSKMISENLQTLSKMISIQWLLIFKKVSLYLSALASLKPQAAPGILPGAAMPAALSKMISQNLRTLSKMISIQCLLIFKKSFPLSFSLDLSLGLPETTGCTRHRTRGSHASCIVKDDFTKPMNFVKDDFKSMTSDI